MKIETKIKLVFSIIITLFVIASLVINGEKNIWSYLLIIICLPITIWSMVGFALQKSKSQVEAENKLKTPQPLPTSPTIPAPTTRNIVTDVELINNRTDKPYYFKSVNDFGLTWTYLHAQDAYSGLVLKQRTGLGVKEWIVLGSFTGFSISKINQKTINI